MREVWLARLTGPAHEEAVRPPEEHVALQQALQELGFVPPGPIDGVYGRATRSAILAWQSARGRVVIGFLGDADALALEREISRGSGTIRGPQQAAMEPAGEVPDRVPLVETNGIYTVPVLINGVLPLQFVLDSGAADVSLPADVFLTLIRTGTIVKEDYIGKGGYRLADGSTVQSDRFFIRELKVGNKVLKNISTSVGGVDSSLLLGQSFLKRFASVQIDNNRNVLVLGDERIDVPTFSNSLPSPPAASIYSPESRPNTATALPTTNQGSRGRIGVKIQDHVTGQHEEPSDTPRERQSLKSRWADLLTALALSRAISFSQLMGRGCTAGPIC
jgi:hypothetical protein